MRPAWSVGHQSSRFDILTTAVDCRQSHTSRQGIGSDPIGEHDGIGRHIKCVRAGLERFNGGRDILDALDFEQDDIEVKGARRCRNFARLDDGTSSVDIRYDRQATETGDHLAQKLKTLAGRIGLLERQSGEVAARTRQANDDTGADRIHLRGKDDRDNLRGPRLAARTGAEAHVTMTSTLSLTSSAAISA